MRGIQQTPAPIVRVILVGSIYARNVGSVSRVISNLGNAQLFLIDPKCDIRSLEARQGAASGQGPLDEAVLFASWKDYEQQSPGDVRIAFSARDGQGRLLQDFPTLMRYLQAEHPLFESSRVVIDLIFGPEDHGLSQDDLAHAHFCARLPIAGPNPSLNLSHAVLLSLFILKDFWTQPKAEIELTRASSVSRTKSKKVKMKSSNRKSLSGSPERLERVLRMWLEDLGMVVTERRMSALSVLKRLMLHSVPSAKEQKILEVVLEQTRRKLSLAKKMEES